MQFNRGSAAVKFYEIDYKDSVVKIQTAVDLSNYLSTMKSLPETIVSRHNKTLFGSDGAITTDGLTDQLVKG